MLGAVGEADAGECGAGLGGVGHGMKVLGEHDVFERGEVGDEVELLEDEADLFGAEVIEGGGAHGAGVGAVDAELAAGGLVEAAEEIDEGAFAGAGGAGDGDPLAGDDREGGVGQGADGAGAAGVVAGDVVEGDDGALGSGLLAEELGGGGGCGHR